MKRTIFSVIRGTHRVVARRRLPDRLALYFHDLPEATWPRFREAISYFKDRGYRLVNLDGLLASVPGEKVVWVSFDDNHAVWWRALPLFSELGVKASFFVNTGPLAPGICPTLLGAYYDRIDHHGERQPLSVAQLRDLADHGHTIGCHSAWHYPLSALCASRWQGELADSKRHLEDAIAAPVTDLAFPFGMRRFFSPKLADYCAAIGISRIVYGIPGFLHEPAVDPLMIHRTRWLLENDLAHNVDDLCIDGRLFERLTGRSAIG